jgi:hypothetical protein
MQLCVALHNRVSLEAIRNQFGWSEADLLSRIDLLELAGLVSHSPSGAWLPSFMVNGVEGAKRYLPVSRDVVRRASRLISKQMPEILRSKFQNSGNEPAATVFFVLSDFLLDNGQIKHRNSVLGSGRPLRDGNHHYLAILERHMDDQHLLDRLD